MVTFPVFHMADCAIACELQLELFQLNSICDRQIGKEMCRLWNGNWDDGSGDQQFVLSEFQRSRYMQFERQYT